MVTRRIWNLVSLDFADFHWFATQISNDHPPPEKTPKLTAQPLQIQFVCLGCMNHKSITRPLQKQQPQKLQ